MVRRAGRPGHGEAFEKALSLDPGGDAGGALSNLAVLNSEVLGRHDDAIVSARRLLQIPPVRLGIIYHLAWPLLLKMREQSATLAELSTMSFPSWAR